MKSQIKIDFKGTEKGLQPIIAIKMQDSEDPRDGLLKAFFEQLGGESSWLSLTFDHHIVNGVNDSTTYITIYPVAASDLEETSSIIQRRLEAKEITPAQNFNPLG